MEDKENVDVTSLRNLLNELKKLTEAYIITSAGLVSRGIQENTKIKTAKVWSDKKIEKAEQALEKLGKEILGKGQKIGETIANAGLTAVGLGVMGARGAIKGAKTLGKGIDKTYKKVDGQILAYRIAAERTMRNKTRKIQKYAKGKVEKISGSLDDELASKVADKLKNAEDNVNTKLEEKGKIKTVRNAAKALGTVSEIRIIKGARTVKNAVFIKPKDFIKQKAQKMARKIQKFAKGKVNDMSGSLDDELANKVADKLQTAEDNVNVKVEDVGVRKAVVDAVKALGTASTIKTRQDARILKNDAKQKVTDVKNNVEQIITDVGGVAELVGKAVKTPIENETDKIKKNAAEAKDRFNKRKNDTLIEALGVGEEFSKSLLEKISATIKSKQEQLAEKNEQLAKKTNDKKQDIDLNIM